MSAGTERVKGSPTVTGVEEAWVCDLLSERVGDESLGAGSTATHAEVIGPVLVDRVSRAAY